MEENKTFYIRYGTYAPVGCHTHITSDRTRRDFPLETVSDLITVFFPKLTPFELASYRLYVVVDGVETSLRPGLKLMDINGGETDDDPLIIRSDQGPDRQIGILHLDPTKHDASHSGQDFLHIRSDTISITGDLTPFTNEALLEYQKIAEQLKTEASVCRICERLDEITSGPIQPSLVPFIFLEGSSGVGKSQMSFNIMAFFRGRKKIFYFLFSPPPETSQKIYLNFRPISSLFHNCIKRDSNSYRQGATSPTEEDWPRMKLFIFGFIYHLLSQGSTGEYSIAPKTGKEILDLMTELGIAENRPVFIIDECIAIIKDNAKKLTFVRRCFRSLRLGLVLLGTDSRAAQLPEMLGRTSRVDKPFCWCYIFSEYPAYTMNDSDAQNLPKEVISLLKSSRPYFSSLFLDAYKCDTNIDNCLSHVFKLAARAKSIFNNVHGRLGQVRLLQNAYTYAKYEKPFSTALIHSHFAKLYGIDNVVILSDGPEQNQGESFCEVDVSESDECMSQQGSDECMSEQESDECMSEQDLDEATSEHEPKEAMSEEDSDSQSESTPDDATMKKSDGSKSYWQPRSVFPPVENDVLLYMSFLGGLHHSAFSLKTSVPYGVFLAKCMESKEARSYICDFLNREQTSNDGKFLESLLSSTICLASHSNGIGGIGFEPFLSHVVYHLQMKLMTPKQVKIDGLDQLMKFKNIVIPFLAPPNVTWPDWIKSLERSRFGNMMRLKNQRRIDIEFGEGMYVECKDYKKALGTGDVEKILKRIPQKSRLFLVAARKLQASYFTRTDRTFHDTFAEPKYSHIKKTSFFKLDASKSHTVLEPFDAELPSSYNAESIVIFILVDKNLK